MNFAVVDASALLAVILNEPKGPRVRSTLAGWVEEGVRLCAPTLLPYEWASSVTRALRDGRLGSHELGQAWYDFRSFPIELHDLGDAGFVAAVEIASRLGRRSAYDAAYLALAQQLGAELWTLDGPLYRNATASGLPVRLFG